MTLRVPPFKVDVEREADIVEEVLRIYGYNNVEFSDTVHSSLSYVSKPDPERVQNVTANYLSSNGFNEILTNSLTSSAYYEKQEIFDKEETVRILNPLSRDLEYMRQTLLFSGLESISYNLNRRQYDLKFYEFGYVYNLNPGKKESSAVTEKFREEKKLAIYITGKQDSESWYLQERKSDYAFLKSYVFGLLRKAGIALYRLQSGPVHTGIFQSGEQFMLDGKELVSLGKVATALLKMFDIKQDVWYAEINWPVLMKAVNPEAARFRDVPRFPEVRRDLALLLEKKVNFDDIEAVAYKNGKGILKEVNLFDVYEGDKIEAGKKSYAVSFILQDDQKTLTDNEIDKLMSRLIEVLGKELGAIIRK
jgi:phenylalanyl-tRNA synthetase beta chain